jgi:hypothetical protein
VIRGLPRRTRLAGRILASAATAPEPSALLCSPGLVARGACSSQIAELVAAAISDSNHVVAFTGRADAHAPEPQLVPPSCTAHALVPVAPVLRAVCGI